LAHSGNTSSGLRRRCANTVRFFFAFSAASTQRASIALASGKSMKVNVPWRESAFSPPRRSMTAFIRAWLNV
jgi:hypothetical protein